MELHNYLVVKRSFESNTIPTCSAIYTWVVELQWQLLDNRWRYYTIILFQLTGTPFRSVARMQSNLRIHDLSGFTKEYAKFSNLILPLMWAEYVSVLRPQHIDLILLNVKKTPKIYYLESDNKIPIHIPTINFRLYGLRSFSLSFERRIKKPQLLKVWPE